MTRDLFRAWGCVPAQPPGQTPYFNTSPKHGGNQMNYSVLGTIDDAPKLPGVYIIMSDLLDECVYVGRATNIQRRLSEHYDSESRESAIINGCYPNRFEYIVFPTHIERVFWNIG